MIYWMVMARRNKTQFVILGLLDKHTELSGYDIKRHIDETMQFFWDESYGQIYPVLRSLHEQGLVERRFQKNGVRPQKQIYSITKKGNEQFNAWLEDRPVMQSVRNELLLKMYFAKEDQITFIKDFVKNLRDDTIRKLEAAKLAHEAFDKQNPEKEYAFTQQIINFGQDSMQQTIKWCDDTLDNLNRRLDT